MTPIADAKWTPEQKWNAIELAIMIMIERKKSIILQAKGDKLVSSELTYLMAIEQSITILESMKGEVAK